MVKQKAELQTESDTLKRSATPRPDWSRCADVVYGGGTRWGELATGKRSSELLAILIDELDGASSHGVPFLVLDLWHWSLLRVVDMKWAVAAFWT